MDYNIMCPIVGEEIEDGNCMEVTACADRYMKPSVIDSRFTDIKNWREVCLNCPNHME